MCYMNPQKKVVWKYLSNIRIWEEFLGQGLFYWSDTEVSPYDLEFMAIELLNSR
jgi:hypothetical protein